MPDLPALPFGAPDPNPRQTGFPGRPRISGPSPQQQHERLGPSFDRLTRAFDSGRAILTDDPEAQESELVLVLEVAGELRDFVRAVQRIPGLEFLAEEMLDKVAPDEFATVTQDGRRRRYDRQMLLVMSDRTAWQQLLSLWERFQQGEQFDHGFAQFRDLFASLRTLRPWDDRDRLERTGVLDVWERELANAHGQLIEFEIELWLRGNAALREGVVATLREDLGEAGGDILDEYVNEEIDYHGLLGRAPANKLREVVDSHEVQWLRTGGVRFFHAAGQMAAVAGIDDDDLESIAAAPTDPADRDPRVAVLDGLPVSGHALLRDRVVVDDPDGWEDVVPAARRIHGTGIASIVVHGDLNGQSEPLPHPPYIRPILRPDAPEWVNEPREELPRDRLAVDLIHSAVARLFQGDQAAAPTVKVIVLAVGDEAHQFSSTISPLARLLDWLSFKYQVLFLVSAGNHPTLLQVGADIDFNDPNEVQHEVLCAIGREAPYRRLLSPAESINALTIGAAHDDASDHVAEDGRLDPMLTPYLPNVTSAAGSGMRRSVKPDVLFPGGRQLIQIEPDTGDEQRHVSVPPSTRPPGIRMAAPSRRPGVLDGTIHNSGTSVAVALAGHHAGRLLDVISELRRIYDERFPAETFDSVILKAALIHTATWGSACPPFQEAYRELTGRNERDRISRHLGYGRVSPEQVLRCDDNTATVIAANSIAKDAAHTYDFPLPSSLSTSTDQRRITMTLAWLTPTNGRHRHYRRAHLKLEPAAPSGFLGDRVDVNQHSARRGTSQHDVMSATSAVPYAPGTTLKCVVSCREDATTLDRDIPYAVIASIEAPESVNLPIYEEVREALRVPIAIRQST